MRGGADSADQDKSEKEEDWRKISARQRSTDERLFGRRG